MLVQVPATIGFGCSRHSPYRLLKPALLASLSESNFPGSRFSSLQVDILPEVRLRFGVYVNPRRKRAPRTPTGHIGCSHPPHPDLRAAARPGYCTRYSTNLRRRITGRARRTLPGTPTPGIAGLDFRRVGHVQEQPQGAL